MRSEQGPGGAPTGEVNQSTRRKMVLPPLRRSRERSNSAGWPLGKRGTARSRKTNRPHAFGFRAVAVSGRSSA